MDSPQPNEKINWLPISCAKRHPNAVTEKHMQTKPAKVTALVITLHKVVTFFASKVAANTSLFRV